MILEEPECTQVFLNIQFFEKNITFFFVALEVELSWEKVRPPPPRWEPLTKNKKEIEARPIKQ